MMPLAPVAASVAVRPVNLSVNEPIATLRSIALRDGRALANIRRYIRANPRNWIEPRRYL